MVTREHAKPVREAKYRQLYELLTYGPSFAVQPAWTEVHPPATAMDLALVAPVHARPTPRTREHTWMGRQRLYLPERTLIINRRPSRKTKGCVVPRAHVWQAEVRSVAYTPAGLPAEVRGTARETAGEHW